jgi:hypothetical protein
MSGGRWTVAAPAGRVSASEVNLIDNGARSEGAQPLRRRRTIGYLPASDRPRQVKRQPACLEPGTISNGWYAALIEPEAAARVEKTVNITAQIERRPQRYFPFLALALLITRSKQAA